MRGSGHRRLACWRRRPAAAALPVGAKTAAPKLCAQSNDTGAAAPQRPTRPRPAKRHRRSRCPVEIIAPPSPRGWTPSAGASSTIRRPARGSACRARWCRRPAPTRMGSRWTSAQGQIEVETFRLHEAALPALFDDEKKTRHRTVEHSDAQARFLRHVRDAGAEKVCRTRPGERQRITWHYHSLRSGDRRRDGAGRAAMADTFQGFPDPNADPPPGLRRSVDYGTAIVVSDRGYLLAAAHVVEQCQIDHRCRASATPSASPWTRQRRSRAASPLRRAQSGSGGNRRPRRHDRQSQPRRHRRSAVANRRQRCDARAGAHDARKASTRRRSPVFPARRRSIRKAALPAWWI